MPWGCLQIEILSVLWHLPVSPALPVSPFLCYWNPPPRKIAISTPFHKSRPFHPAAFCPCQFYTAALLRTAPFWIVSLLTWSFSIFCLPEPELTMDSYQTHISSSLLPPLILFPPQTQRVHKPGLHLVLKCFFFPQQCLNMLKVIFSTVGGNLICFSGLLWIKLLKTFMWKSFCDMHSPPLDKCLAVGLLSISKYACVKLPSHLSKVVVPVCTPISNLGELQLTIFYQNLLLSAFHFSLPTGCYWHFTVLLICASLRNKDVEVFMC